MRRLVFVLAVLAVTGCSEPRIDATNEETALATSKAVLDRMSPAEKLQFQGKLISSAMPKVMKASFSNTSLKMNTADAMKDFHGMTAREILSR